MKKLKIALYACYAHPDTGTFDPDSGVNIAGSEIAMIEMGKELASMGMQVVVFANPPEKSKHSLPGANPKFVHFSKYETGCEGYFSFAACWRHMNWKAAKKYAKCAFVWLHDLPAAPGEGHTVHDLDVSGIDGVFYLTDYHRKAYHDMYPGLVSVPYVLSGNGINASYFPNPEKTLESFAAEAKRNPCACVTASNPARGLPILLRAWPDVKRAVPEATLDLAYGWHTYGNWNAGQEAHMRAWAKSMEPLGVKDHGKLSHADTVKLLLSASVLSNPNISLAETFFMGGIEAQRAGLRCVTTRVAALQETIHPGAPTVQADPYHPQLFGMLSPETYAQKLIQVLQECKSQDAEVQARVLKERAAGIRFVDERFHWSHVAQHWFKLFTRVEEAAEAELAKKRAEMKASQQSAAAATTQQFPAAQQTPAVASK